MDWVRKEGKAWIEGKLIIVHDDKFRNTDTKTI